MFKLIPYLTKHSYYIGFFDKRFLNAGIETRYEHVCWLDLGNYNSGWFADPFFLDINGSVIRLLAEEFLWAKGKGRISLLDIERKENCFVLSRVKPILELDTHLSFPSVCTSGKDVYVLPENTQSGKTTIYSFDSANNLLTNGHILLDTPLVDPCLFEIDGTFILMGTRGSGRVMDRNTHLDIYSSHNLFGPYLHKQTIINVKKNERGAGSVFQSKEGQLIRPVQCCEKRYGEYVIFYELKYNNESFSEEIVYKLMPDSRKPHSYGLHTFNAMDDLCVIDGLTYFYPHLGPLLVRTLDKLFGM